MNSSVQNLPSDKNRVTKRVTITKLLLPIFIVYAESCGIPKLRKNSDPSAKLGKRTKK